MRHSPVPELLLNPPPPLSWGLEIWNGRFIMWDGTHDTGYRFTNTTCLERIPSMVKNRGWAHWPQETCSIRWKRSHTNFATAGVLPQLGNFQVCLTVVTDCCVPLHMVIPSEHAFSVKQLCCVINTLDFSLRWVLQTPSLFYQWRPSQCYWNTLHHINPIFTHKKYYAISTHTLTISTNLHSFHPHHTH